jgi:hypothetical protein
MYPLAQVPLHRSIPTILLAAAALAACADPGPTDPPATTSISQSQDPPNFFVLVLLPSGAAVPNATVMVMRQNGEGRQTLLTDGNGVASFAVANGRYCVVARTVPVAGNMVNFPTFLPDINNPPLTNVVPGGSPVVTGSGGASVEFSATAYQACYQNPTVRVNGPTTSHTMTLAAGKPVTLNTGTFANIDGAQGILASVIVPTPAVPWAPNPLPEGVKPGFYAHGFYSHTGGTFPLIVPSNFGTSFFIELQKLATTSAGSAWVTATVQQSNTENVDMALEPLFCEVAAIVDENTPKSGTDLHVYKHGYLAKANPESLELLPTAWGSQLSFTGPGNFTQDIRFRLANGNTSAKINVSSDGVDSCSASSSSGDVVAFCAKVGSLFYLTTLVPQLPATTNRVESGISTNSGEKIPAPDRSTATSGMVESELPSMQTPYFCPLERSNDDKWFVF